VRADVIGIGAVKEGGVGGDAKAAADGLLDAFDSEIPAALAADGEIVLVAPAVEMDGKGEVL